MKPLAYYEYFWGSRTLKYRGCGSSEGKQMERERFSGSACAVQIWRTLLCFICIWSQT